MVPRSFAAAVLKCAKPLVGMGCGENTFTVYFEGGAWLRTQVYQDKWPDLSNVWHVGNYYEQLPALLFNAIDTVAPFGDSTVYLTDNCVAMSEPVENAVASQTVTDMALKQVIRLPVRSMKHVANLVTWADWYSNERSVQFLGDNFRAVVMRMQS